MEIGTKVITLVEKKTTEGLEDINIPKGTIGTICEIHSDYALVEIWGENAPKGIEGVYDFGFDEIKEFIGFATFQKPNK